MDNLFERIIKRLQSLFNRGNIEQEEKEPEIKEDGYRKGRTIEYDKNHVRVMPNGEMLPLPYESSELHKIVDSIRLLAAGDKNKELIYDTALLIALQPAKDLFDLYYLVPQIWHGDTNAINEFKKLLSRGNEMHKPDVNAFMMQSKQSLNRLHSSTNIPRQDMNRPCEPIFFLKPDIIRTLHHAAYFISGGERKSYQNHVATIDQMWRASATMDSLNVAAHMNERKNGATLEKMVNVIAREHKLPEQMGGSDYPARDSLKAGYGLTYPPIDEPWYPQDPGFGRPPLGPDGGPGYPGMPELPRDCFPFREYCEDVARGITPNYNPLPESVTIGGIAEVSPSHACEGGTVTISGSLFGPNQGDRSVVFGTTEVEVISWSSTEIKVRVPEGLNGSFCVGIRDNDIESERRNIHGSNSASFAGIRDSLRVCFGLPGRIYEIPYRPSTPECTGGNRITIGMPNIHFLTINGSTTGTVITGQDIVLRWKVTNAENISINRIGSNGPSVNITNPHEGESNIGTLNTGSNTQAEYRLTASNACGEVSKTVTVVESNQFNLGILGIEVTQAIQRFDWNNPGQNNSVRLVSRKRTLVRVYLESGMNNGFNFGKGANNLPDVTGHLKLTYPNGNTTTINNVLNPGGKITVLQKQNVDREELDHSLNFELPITNLHGDCTIEAEVSTNFISNNQTVSKSTNVTFLEKNQLTLRRIHVNDTINGIAAPNLNDFSNTIYGARKRVPVGEAGITVKGALGYTSIDTESDEDLTTRDGFRNLLSRIDDIADEFNTENEIWVGLVPNDSSYSINGIATSGSSNPRMVTRNGLRATFTHELGHTVGIGHSSSASEYVGPDVPSEDDVEIDTDGDGSLNFTIHQAVRLMNARLFIENDDTNIIYRLRDNAGNEIGNRTINDLKEGDRNIWLNNFGILSPGDYSLELEITNGGGVGISNASFPYNGGLLSITGSSSSDGNYMYFYRIQALAAYLDDTVGNCGIPKGIDDTLVALTEDVGIKLDDNNDGPTIISKNIPTLMTYCNAKLGGTSSFQNRWTSIDLWDRFWDQI